MSKVTYRALENAYTQSPGKYHVYADDGSMTQSEELAIRKNGAYKNEADAKAAAQRLNESSDRDWET